MLLAVLCLGILSACKVEKADYFNYSKKDLNLIGKLIAWMHGWIGNYGWTVVVFTVFLKLLTLPLDIWQRVSSRKSAVKMQQIQPLLDEIDKRYGANTQRSNMEKQKLYKKQGTSMLSMCLPMIMTMVIFFVMFGGLRDYSKYSSVTSFQSLSGTYYDAYYQAVKADSGDEYQILKDNLGADLVAEIEKNENYLRDHYTQTNVNKYDSAIAAAIANSSKDEQFKQTASEKVTQYYKTHHESFLWLKNVWQPDTWAPIMPKLNDRNNGFSNEVDMDNFGTDKGVAHYDIIRNAVLKDGGWGKNGSWNGLMILPILSVGLSFLSIFLSQLMDKKSRKNSGETVQSNPQQAASNKTMMIVMPLMMAFFGFMYTGAFAIYMVCNYALGIVSTVALRIPVDKIVERSIARAEKKQNSGKADYMR